MRSPESKQRGMSLPMVAICITTLLALSALAIDLGIVYTARTSAQHAADAAALAGAYTFIVPGSVQPGAAKTAAVNVAAQNSILHTPVAITADDVIVNEADRQVTVHVPRTGASAIPTYFANIFGKTSVEVMATATAEAAKTGTGTSCLKPVYIPNTVLSDKNPDRTKPGNACDAKEVIFNNDGSVNSTFVQTKLGSLEPIRPANPVDSLEPSQFYSIDFGSGADTYRCTLGQCLDECATDVSVARCYHEYPLKTGAMVGPTKQGVNDLTGPTPDQWVALGQYMHEDGKIYDTSKQLVVAPVWNNCQPPDISPGYHDQKVQIMGFVQLFIAGYKNNPPNEGVQARFVNAIQCSEAGASEGDALGGNTGPFGIPIKLVRTPQ